MQRRTKRDAEERACHARQMEVVGHLAGGFAHDFANVITVVQGYASMLEETLEPSDARSEDVAAIRRAAERGGALARQLRALSGASAAAPELLAIDTLVMDMMPVMRRLVGDGIAIVTHATACPRVLVDARRLEQVLLNLALHARDTMPGGGRLTIETRRVDVDDENHANHGVQPGSYVELAITDTGDGGDATAQPAVLDPHTLAADPGGDGLVLAMVHAAVTQAGGVIVHHSERGRGSTLRIYLRAAGIRDGVDAPARTAPATLPPLHVLVVDDQPEVRALATRVLRAAGCAVIEASSCEDAQRICVSHDHPIDLVLLDAVLPDGRGDALIPLLRAVRPSLTVVQMSGYPAGSLAGAGATPAPLLAKPFSAGELRAAIASACNASASEVGVAATPATDDSQRVLTVDDDPTMRRVVARLLRRAGFEVVEVDSGTAAMTELAARRFDVVVSDVHMPDGGGLDLLRAVRRVDLDVPVILMTGDLSLEGATAAVEYGAFRYLRKPLDTAVFVKTVAHAARAHTLARLRREALRVSGHHAGVSDRAGLEVRFEKALEEMWMAFQPIVYARTGALYGVEALLRTNESSMPTPVAVLDAAKQLGRLAVLGRRARSLSLVNVEQRADDVALFINLHPEDLFDADLLDTSSALAGVAARVILEVTERDALETSPALTERIARLRAMGFRLAVDDIGAGYSGLSSFTELTPEVVKIDMSLVRDVHKSALKQRTIAALCTLCHEADALVVAEGIETAEERTTMVALGCDLMQGYLIGRPQREPPADLSPGGSS